jgi:hypothetical protein
LVKGIKEAGEKFEKVSIKTVINSVKELVEDVVKKRGKIRQNIIELAESKQYAKLYANKIGIKDADFEDWFKNTFVKYEGNTLNFEAHHVIPIDVLKTNPDLQKLLFDLKKADPNFNFDFNNIENGMMIQKKNLKLDVNGHTVHNKYNDAISNKITAIISEAGGDNQVAIKKIEKLIKNTKEKLKTDVLLGDKNVDDIIEF